MGPADLWTLWWTGVLFSASPLPAWSPPAAAQSTSTANPLDTSLELSSSAESPSNPTISVSEYTVTEYMGKVTFYCDTVDVNITIQWLFNNSLLVDNERLLLSPDGRSLTILTVQREDSGTYQCDIQGSNITFLNVHYGPDPIEIKLESGVPNRKVVEVLEGSTVNLTVETQCHPDPDYKWYLPNGSVVSSTARTLTIDTVTMEHEGTFRCLVSNTATYMSRLGAVRVQVLENLTKPQVESPSMDLVEKVSVLNLTCQTRHQGVSFQWFQSYQPLLPSEHLALSDDNRTLVIHHLQRNDTGPYECEIWHSLHRAQSDPLTLTIYYGPDSVEITKGSESEVVDPIQVKLNSNLTLQCQAESKPEAEYHWFFKDFSGAFNGQHLLIGPATKEHQGIYNCTAVNARTGRSSSASVRVKTEEPLPAWAIALIVIAILVLIVAVLIGLGCFIRKKRRSLRASANDPIPEATPPTYVREDSTEPSSNNPNPVYDNVPELPGQIRVNQEEPAWANPGSSSASPRKPPRKPQLQPPAPRVPEAREDADYQTLVNPEPENYYQINPSA